MQTSAKSLVFVILAAVLLSWVSGPSNPLRHFHDHRGSRQRHRALVRLRRCRGDNPAHHPVRPCKNAVLPPDGDDDLDPARLHAKAPFERLPSSQQEPASPSFSLRFGSRPLPTDIPRHQALCILLI